MERAFNVNQDEVIIFLSAVQTALLRPMTQPPQEYKFSAMIDYRDGRGRCVARFYKPDSNLSLGDGILDIKSPYAIGMNLWVRETWIEGYDPALSIAEGDDRTAVSIIYKADGTEEYRDCSEDVVQRWGDWTEDGIDNPRYHPSVHMPRWMSRITLNVVGVLATQVGKEWKWAIETTVNRPADM